MTVNTFLMFQIISVLKKCGSVELLFAKESCKKMYHGFHKTLGSKTVFNIDNKECFFSIKSAYYNDFWRDHVTLKTAVMMLKIQLFHRNKLHFKIY